jgi:hypothetical protein
MFIIYCSAVTINSRTLKTTRNQQSRWSPRGLPESIRFRGSIKFRVIDDTEKWPKAVMKQFVRNQIWRLANDRQMIGRLLTDQRHPIANDRQIVKETLIDYSRILQDYYLSNISLFLSMSPRASYASAYVFPTSNFNQSWWRPDHIITLTTSTRVKSHVQTLVPLANFITYPFSHPFFMQSISWRDSVSCFRESAKSLICFEVNSMNIVNIVHMPTASWWVIR